MILNADDNALARINGTTTNVIPVISLTNYNYHTGTDNDGARSA